MLTCLLLQDLSQVWSKLSVQLYEEEAKFQAEVRLSRMVDKERPGLRVCPVLQSVFRLSKSE